MEKFMGFLVLVHIRVCWVRKCLEIPLFVLQKRRRCEKKEEYRNLSKWHLTTYLLCFILWDRRFSDNLFYLNDILWNPRLPFGSICGTIFGSRRNDNRCSIGSHFERWAFHVHVIYVSIRKETVFLCNGLFKLVIFAHIHCRRRNCDYGHGYLL